MREKKRHTFAQAHLTLEENMLDRRRFLLFGVTGALASITKAAAQGTPSRVVFVHGRDQQGKDPALLKAEWVSALKIGAGRTALSLPANLEVEFPYYGDILDDFVQRFEIPLTLDIQTKGSPVDSDFLRFQADVAEELRQGAGISDSQIDSEYGRNPKPKGPLNWEWVQAILRTLDKYGGSFNQLTLESFTRDVFLYTTRTAVRQAIDQIVARSLADKLALVVGHSLGSIVAYSVLRDDPHSPRVPLFVTVGSPLGIRAIRDRFLPLKHPQSVLTWYNAFDNRDVVALYPLDATNFAVTPSIENFDKVRNHTPNRHGIIGYLDDATVAKRIVDALVP